MKNISILFSVCIASLMLNSCTQKSSDEAVQIPVVMVKTEPVLLGEIESMLSFNGKTVYLKKNQVVTPISGYVCKVSVKFGDAVKKGQFLFQIQTKENKALENSNSGNMGIVNLVAPSHGVISTLNITESGTYVTEGTSLCTVAESGDVMVQLNLPFEYNSLIKIGAKCTLILNDGTKLSGSIYQILPTIDDVNQTQQILIKPHTHEKLPENLNLSVEILQTNHTHSCLVPRASVMSNETQTDFWVMKAVNGKWAIKVPIKKGLENDHLIEVLSANLNNNDLVVSEGAYGLADSAMIKIEK